MYHDICKSSSEAKGLTVSGQNFEAQLVYLKENNYQTFHFSELQDLKTGNDLPNKPVIITFDDVYKSQLDIAIPLLIKYGFKATFFVPFKYIGGKDLWNSNSLEIMSVNDLKSLDASIELGLHSFEHKKYHEMSLVDIQEDFNHCKRFIIKHKLNVNNILAYPYGKFPRKKEEKQAFFNLLHQNKMAYGLRIGNRVNKFPFKNNYELNRIDIKGEDSLFTFKRKLKIGKWL